MDEVQAASYEASIDAVAGAAVHNMGPSKPTQRDGLAAAAEELRLLPFNIHFFEETTLFAFIGVEVVNPNRSKGALKSLVGCFAWSKQNNPPRTLFTPPPDTF
jgi:hypothetical protein